MPLAHDKQGCTLSDEEHDWHVLALASETGKIAIEISETYAPCTAVTLERGFDNGLWYLMDVAYVADERGYPHFCRILKLTPKGRRLYDDLKFKFAPAANTSPA